MFLSKRYALPFLFPVFLISSAAFAPSATASGLSQLRRAFRQHSSALVRVRSRTSPRAQTGFLIGAEGEIVFGAKKLPSRGLEVLCADGQPQKATLLGFDRDLRLAVARLLAPCPGAALELGTARSFQKDTWYLALGFSRKGRPEPFAGMITTKPRKALRGVRRVGLMLTGQLGSPVLDRQGKLLAVVSKPGKRRCQAWLMEDLVPFLKRVVFANPSESPAKPR